MNYLLMVQLRPDSDRARLGRDAKLMLQAVQRYSKGDQQLAYTSPEGHAFGILFSSDEDPSPLQREFSSGQFFLNGDGMVLVEVGDLKAGIGMTRTWNWLQHRR